jgi:hypothetical protein
MNRSLEASSYKGGIYYPKEAITPVDVVFSAVANYSLWGGPIMYMDHACWCYDDADAFTNDLANALFQLMVSACVCLASLNLASLKITNHPARSRGTMLEGNYRVGVGFRGRGVSSALTLRLRAVFFLQTL